MKPTAPILISVALGLAACAGTPARQAGGPPPSGFTDQRIDASHYRVSFAGAADPSRPRVERYLLYRAADLTVGEGYDWFEMVDGRSGRDGRRAWRPAWSFDRRPGFDVGGGPQWGAYDSERVAGYEATAEIAVGRGPKPGDDPRAFDAREVMTRLGVKAAQPS